MRRAERHERNAMRKEGTVDLDLDAQKPLTKSQRAEVKALVELPDHQIDTTNIPRSSDAFWKNAVRNPFYRPVIKR
jgi:hypothetical protein